jgi:YD repeat-containing protein
MGCRGIGTAAFVVLVLAATASESRGQTPTRVGVMPGYPNAPALLPEQRRPVRPDVPVCVWGNANGGYGATPVGSTYAWSFAPNQNLLIQTDGNLGGTVASDRFICEVVTFVLLNGSPKETVTATLTVDGGAAGIAARSVQLEVIAPEADPLTKQNTDVRIAVEEGLKHLYRQAIYVAPTGSTPARARWDQPQGYQLGAQAFALWAFQNQGHLPVDAHFGEDVYAEWVQMGLDWIFAGLTTTTDLSANRANVLRGATQNFVSDLNGNGVGAQLSATSQRGYEHGIAACAVVASGQPDRLVTHGPKANATYREVVEDAIDWLGANQNEGGGNTAPDGTGLTSWNGRGGWEYTPASSDTTSDMSINSWPYVLLEGAADVFAIGVPDWIKQEIEYGVVKHQAATGLFGYQNANPNNNGMATTAGGLSGLVLVETMGAFVPPLASPQAVGQVIAQSGVPAQDTLAEKRTAALNYVAANWHTPGATNNNPWGGGNLANFYTMWTMARALRLTEKALGIPEDQTLPLTNGGVAFDWETGRELASGVVAAAGTAREGYYSYLVRTQNASTGPAALDAGSWPDATQLRRTIATAMGVLVLTPRVFVDPCPTVVNIPIVQLQPSSTAALPAGAQVVLSGRAVSQAANRPVLQVLVNGEPVDGLDLAGNFFKTVTIGAGANVYAIRAVDACGFAEALHTLVGGATTPEFSDLQDVTLDVAIAYSNTTFDLQTNRLVVTAVATNVSDHVVDAPLLMVVENVTQPSVTLQNADGVTPAGKPYFVFLDPAVAARLEPGQSTPPRTLVFHNPNRVGVVFTKSFKSETNGPPYFVSAPPVETAAGVPLAYQAVVADPNDDVPTFVLLVGPPGFVVDPISGLATWAPTPADLGTHAVSIRAVDGRGGAATQSWNLSVVAAIANRPPLIVSVPVVQSVVGASYAYQALATDPDGDGVVFSKDAGPAGVSVSATGAVAWSFVDPGLHTVRIRAIDPSGAFAQQEWAIAAGVASPNPHAPQILSTPPATAVVNVPFLYQPTVVDPDAGQTVAWSFAAAPSGASVDPATGLVSWVPGASQTGTQAFELRATDSLGAYSAQGWTVVVQITGPNLAPTFQSAPALFVDVGSPYSYQAVAADPEFDPVEYAVAVGPPGLVVGLTSGLVQWPTPVLGAHLVQLRATDLFGAQAYQSYYLQVLPPNHPPVFTSAPPAAAAVGAAFLYDANASDPDADLLTFALVAGPAGMIVAPDSGHVLWTPTFAQAGAHAVTLSVSDGRGGLATQSFGLNAVADNQAPLVTIVATPNPAPLGATVQICVQAGDNVGVVNRTLAIAGVPTPLDAFGCAYWTAPATPGPVALTATAEDASTNAGTTAATLQVVDPNVGAPAVTIHAPVPGTVVDRPTDVVATISSSDPNPPPVTWEVRLRNTRTDAVKTAATGSGYVAQAVLGRLDPTLLCNDTYLVEIVVDNLVYATTEPTLVHVVGDFKLGHFAYQTADLHVPVAGIPLTVTRRYDSLDVGQGDFGAGWSLGLNVNVTDGPADGTGPNPSPQAFYGGTRVYVTRTDGERVSFKFDPQPFPFPFSFLLTPRYTPDDGVEGTLEALDGGETAVVSGGVFFADFGFGGVYNPTRYRYVNGEGVAFEIHEKNGLESVTDAFGNQLVVTPGGIVSSTGAALVFDRDALGRIVRVEAPAPSPGSSPIETHYAYDAAGNLVSFVDPGGSTTTYLYGNAAFPHYLTEIRDPLNRPLIRNVYDAEGRLSAQCGPDGDLLTLSGCSQFVLDPDASVQTTFDNLGVRTDYVLDAAGRTLVKRRWKGGVGYDLTYVYDAEGRVLTQTNPAGDTWNYGYDAEGRVTAAIDPAGRTFAMTYDADGRITSRTDPGGATYAYAYTAQGAISAITTPLGAATQFQYDAYGRATAVLDPVGNAWTFVYGNAAAPVTVVYPDGSTETSSYDDAGRLLFRVDRAGKRVDFAWDAAGRLVQETWDDGRTVTYAYDATGKPTSVTDPDAAVQYAYWNTGLLKETVVVPADGGPVVPVRLRRPRRRRQPRPRIRRERPADVGALRRPRGDVVRLRRVPPARVVVAGEPRRSGAARRARRAAPRRPRFRRAEHGVGAARRRAGAAGDDRVEPLRPQDADGADDARRRARDDDLRLRLRRLPRAARVDRPCVDGRRSCDELRARRRGRPDVGDRRRRRARLSARRRGAAPFGRPCAGIARPRRVVRLRRLREPDVVAPQRHLRVPVGPRRRRQPARLDGVPHVRLRRRGPRRVAHGPRGRFAVGLLVRPPRTVEAGGPARLGRNRDEDDRPHLRSDRQPDQDGRGRRRALPRVRPSEPGPRARRGRRRAGAPPLRPRPRRGLRRGPRRTGALALVRQRRVDPRRRRRERRAGPPRRLRVVRPARDRRRRRRRGAEVPSAAVRRGARALGLPRALVRTADRTVHGARPVLPLDLRVRQQRAADQHRPDGPQRADRVRVPRQGRGAEGVLDLRELRATDRRPVGGHREDLRRARRRAGARGPVPEGLRD